MQGKVNLFSNGARASATLLILTLLYGCETVPLSQVMAPNQTAAKTSGTMAPVASTTTAVARTPAPSDAGTGRVTAADPDVARVNAQADDIRGEWVGQIDCGRGAAELRMTFSRLHGGPNMLGGMALLKPAPGSKAEAGSYSFKGEIRQGELRLRLDNWLQKSKSFPNLSMDTMIYSGPERITGRVLEARCSPVELRRPGSVFDSTATQPMPTQSSGASKAITHAQFLNLLGKEKLPTLIGTTLQLNLKKGGSGGWEGFIEDPQSLLFFSCPSSTRNYNGGSLIAKVAKIRSNDMGVYVNLDRCDSSPSK